MSERTDIVLWIDKDIPKLILFVEDGSVFANAYEKTRSILLQVDLRMTMDEARQLRDWLSRNLGDPL